MLKPIKNLIKLSLNKLGYKLVSIYESKDNFLTEKYEALIKEVEYLYKEFIFKDLSCSDVQRIKLMSNLLGTNISEAIYILNYLNISLELEGDICEFGIAQGATSALLAYESRHSNKNIWLFDSFEGLPKPSEKDILKDDIFNLGSISAYAGTMSCKVDMVKERINEIKFPFERVKIVAGFIEETINYSNLPDRVCFAYVDFDFYEPILIALNFLDKVLQQKGVIIVDDYEWFSTGAKTAVDEFIAANQEKYKFSLPNKAVGHFCILEKK